MTKRKGSEAKLEEKKEDIDKAAQKAKDSIQSVVFPKKMLCELTREEFIEEIAKISENLRQERLKEEVNPKSKSKVEDHGEQAKIDIQEITEILKKKTNVDHIGNYVSGRLREKNPLVSRKIKCLLLKPVDDKIINIIAAALVQLDDNEITYALAKGKDATAPAKLDNEISIEELNKHVRTDREYYDVVTNQLKCYAPKLRYFDKDFINDLFTERKKLYGLNEIVFVKPPKNALFTLEGNDRYWKDPDIAVYLPNSCHDRTYMFTILNTVKKGIVDKAIDEFNKTKTEEIKNKKLVIKATSGGFGQKFVEAVKNRFTRSSARRSLTHKLSVASMEKEPKERKKRTYADISIKDSKGDPFEFKELKSKRPCEEKKQ